MGTGINKIKSLLKENGNLEPIFEFDEFYTIIFKRANGGVKPNEEKLLEIIKNNQGKRTNELSKIIKISEKTIEKWIDKLKGKNLIAFEGSSKTGGYFAKDEIKENRLLEIIKNKPGNKTNELAKIINSSERTVEKWLKKLKNNDKIEFKGSSKTGGYFVK